METNFNKPNPKRILGYLMAFAMVFFTTSYAIAHAYIGFDPTIDLKFTNNSDPNYYTKECKLNSIQDTFT